MTTTIKSGLGALGIEVTLDGGADATEAVKGVVLLATTAEAVVGTDTDKALTCAGLTARMEAPGEIGGTTPAAATFTTLAATTATVTTANATTFDTNVAAAGVTLAGTTLAADGTDAAININITPKGTGSVVISKADINGGAVDGTVIGGAAAAAGTFTTIAGASSVTLGAVGGALGSVVLTGTTSGTATLTTDATGSKVAVNKPLDITGGVTTSTAIVAPAGSAGAPAYTFTGDTDNGFILSAANAVGIVTGGTERWVVNASGSLVPVADGAYDIGNGTVDPRDISATRTITAGTSYVLGTETLILHGAGAPVDYTDGDPAATGEGTAGIGSLYIDTTAGKLYLNGGTKAQPIWKLVTSAA